MKHVVSVLPQCTKDGDDLDCDLDYFSKMLELLLRTDQYSFANVNQGWDVLEFAEQHQVTLVFILDQLQNFLESLLKALVVTNGWVNLFLEVDAFLLQHLLVGATVIFPSMVVSSNVVCHGHLLQLQTKSFDLPLECLFFFFDQLLADITRCTVEAEYTEAHVFELLDAQVGAHLLVMFVISDV